MKTYQSGLLARVVRVGRARLQRIEQAGLTPALLDALEASNNEFLTRMDNQTDAKYDQSHAADGRILAGKALYTELLPSAAAARPCTLPPTPASTPNTW